jgi:hypothetical protein
MAVYLALAFAYVTAVLARIDEPQPSLTAALLPAISIGALAQVGLFWAPSAKGRRRIYAALLMVPSAVLLGLSAREELSLMAGGHMHAPTVAFTYIGGVTIYAWQFVALLRRKPTHANGPVAA